MDFNFHIRGKVMEIGFLSGNSGIKKMSIEIKKVNAKVLSYSFKSYYFFRKRIYAWVAFWYDFYSLLFYIDAFWYSKKNFLNDFRLILNWWWEYYTRNFDKNDSELWRGNTNLFYWRNSRFFLKINSRIIWCNV